jgi:hypothetical protein
MSQIAAQFKIHTKQLVDYLPKNASCALVWNDGKDKKH